ncbi:mitochondrial-processing peptidase subunit alpha [[Candida] railenensis]|uniref:Alpha-MPP n=1 Tax=[Candida] railenensis TaxID=45579 RepID=A0A9P0QMK8_9ASCO|nr:mitochondrial-processing peptidase subunit alpha [[Candida] railenensis]
MLRSSLIGRSIRRLSTNVEFANPNIQMTTLQNGLRIVSDSTPGHFSALGMYVDAGSRYENPQKPGVSHIFDRLAWKSTQKYSGLEMMENLAKVGGNYICSSQRESMLYQASVFNTDVDKMFDYMSQTVREPKITDLEFQETLQTVAFEVQSLQDKYDVRLPETLHSVAYKDNTLGLPLFCPEDRILQVDQSEVLEYHKKFYQPQNIVVAMIGVEHERAVQMAMSQLGDWKPTTRGRPSLGTIKYTGGTQYLPHQPPQNSYLPSLYHMQVGFETTGLLSDDLYALATLQKLLGGGSSFSAGGPGKGMFSRLFTRVLNQHAFVENCSAFNHSYIDSGIFGITVSVLPEYGQYMPDIICREFVELLDTQSKNGITEQELQRAKNQLISSLLMNVESKLSALEDLGRQIQCQGKLTTIDEMVNKIENLSVKDVRDVAYKVLTGNVVTKGVSSGKPSVVVQGDENVIGDVDKTISACGLGK